MKRLTDRDIATLRSSGKIRQDEAVVLEGDLIVAVDARSGSRRVVDAAGIMLEGTRGLLLD